MVPVLAMLPVRMLLDSVEASKQVMVNGPLDLCCSNLSLVSLGHQRKPDLIIPVTQGDG